MALTKPPPPPPIASKDPTLNRWFLAVTAFLNSNGTIDGGSVDGFGALQADVAALETDVAILQGQVGALQGQVTALQASITTLNGQVTALQARAQVFNGTVDPLVGQGSNGDWYANTAGAAGHRIFVKVGGAWVAFPF